MFCSLLAAALLTTPQTGHRWVQLDGPRQPGYQAAFDASRGRLVAIGYGGETWELEGAARLHRADLGSEGGPPRRLGGAMGSRSYRHIDIS